MSPMKNPTRPNKTTFLLVLLLILFLAMYLYYNKSDAPVNKADPVASRDNIVNVLPPPQRPLNKKDIRTGPSIRMDDPDLVTFLREKFLLRPPPSNVALNLSNPWLYDTSMGQAAMIKKLLKHQRNGFFVECGALDGETRSNTLLFERLYNWTGLLIEADPLNYSQAVHKRRKAYLSQSCLSIKPYPDIVSFEQGNNIGKISGYPAGFESPGYVDVQCFPFFTYLLALNRTAIDYFSLDVEGSELEVLETIPFDKVDIKTLSVEFFHGSRGKDQLRSFMELKGYVMFDEVTHFDNLANDFIFVKRSLTR